MRCIICHSYTIIKFIDGFGSRRLFCRNCRFNPLENNIVDFAAQKKLREFLQEGIRWS